MTGNKLKKWCGKGSGLGASIQEARSALPTCFWSLRRVCPLCSAIQTFPKGSAQGSAARSRCLFWSLELRTIPYETEMAQCQRFILHVSRGSCLLLPPPPSWYSGFGLCRLCSLWGQLRCLAASKLIRGLAKNDFACASPSASCHSSQPRKQLHEPRGPEQH